MVQPVNCQGLLKLVVKKAAHGGTVPMATRALELAMKLGVLEKDGQGSYRLQSREKLRVVVAKARRAMARRRWWNRRKVRRPRPMSRHGARQRRRKRLPSKLLRHRRQMYEGFKRARLLVQSSPDIYAKKASKRG
uniref:Uncharacterized protein n=1 Tax=Graphocephala atropunctata TaxID=36148 RepID=A0A1B6KB41_9HEMI